MIMNIEVHTKREHFEIGLYPVNLLSYKESEEGV
jgi:hypothetical protein